MLITADNKPGIDYIDERDALYFNKYKYRASFYDSYLVKTRYAKTPIGFANRVFSDTGSYLSWSLSQEDKEIIYDNLGYYSAFILWRNSLKGNKDVMIRLQDHNVSIYTNDITYIDNFKSIYPIAKYVYITEAIASGIAGVKRFSKEPKYQYRVYFTNCHVNQEYKVKFCNFLYDNLTLFHPSRSLHKWMTYKDNRQWLLNYIRPSFYVEYNEPSTLSYLALKYGEILGKHYKLEKVQTIQ